MKRSHLIGVTAAAAIAVSFATPATGSAEVARDADDFVDSIGVNTHSYYPTTSYANYSWREKLLGSGIRHIRENLQRSDATQAARINDLYEAGGIQTSFILDPRRDRGGSVRELFRRLKSAMLPATAQVEGPNELENSDEYDWDSERARAYQARLYAIVKRDSSTAHLPVLGPSVAHLWGYDAWGDLSRWLDQGNMHPYTGGRPPAENLDEWTSAARAISGTKPVQATETGYHNALATTDAHEPASDRAAGVYVPGTYLEYFRRGVIRTYAYELLDEGRSSSDIEKNFGLLRADYGDKPAMSALRNLIALLEDSGPFFTPGSLDYFPATSSSDVRHLLLQKRDGSFWLALWRDVSVWDESDRQELHPGTTSVTLTLADPVVRAAVYMPSKGISPTATASDPTFLNLDVGPAVTLVELTPSKERAAYRQSVFSDGISWLSQDLLPPSW